ncbi:MAG: hypothetical protein L3J79_08540 [Candidatus Marinimicrobia bacterium]|nr:hypothetical protein [Candidatus Neomarinimicrobiota bacterium]
MIMLIKILLSASLFLPLSLFANEAIKVTPKMPEVMGASNILQIVAGLFVVLMVIMAVAWMLKRYGGFGGMANNDLKVVAGITVGQR